jgi:hypothetical protein
MALVACTYTWKTGPETIGTGDDAGDADPFGDCAVCIWDGYVAPGDDAWFDDGGGGPTPGDATLEADPLD